jgi:hypothetical protein
LLVLPNRRQSLVVHRCAVVLRVGLSQVYPRKIMSGLSTKNHGVPCSPLLS